MEIDVKTFYRIGMVLFFIIAIGNAINLKINYSLMNIGGKISGFAGILFNITLIGFFSYLLKQQTMIAGNPDEQEELNKLMEELKSN